MLTCSSRDSSMSMAGVCGPAGGAGCRAGGRLPRRRFAERRGRGRSLQAIDNFAEELRQVGATLLAGEGYRHGLFRLDAVVPVVDDGLGGPFEEGSEAFDGPGTMRAGGEPPADRVDQDAGVEGFDEDIVGLEDDGVGRGMHGRECGQEQSDGLGVGRDAWR